MGVPNVVYKWKSLRTLYVSVFVMNVFGFVIVVIMIVSAVKLRMGTGQYLDLVVPGAANFWPGMMFLIAFLCAPIYAIGTKLCFHLRFSTPDSIPRLNQVLFIHCALCFASMIIVIGINVVGILHMVNFHRNNGNGMIESMQEYATDVVAKVRIDMIQINFKCCGSNSFKDWFRVRWMLKEGEIPENREQNDSWSFSSTDVPFSCCATEMLKPCIHYNILKPSEVYLYQPEHRLTIATTGCQAKVLSHARYIGGMLIIALILLAAYQMVLALFSRLLQTAHSTDLYIGPKKDRYVGWIFGGTPNAETYNRSVYGGRQTPDAFDDMGIPLHQETLMDSRILQMEEDEDHDQKRRSSDINLEKKSLGHRRCSKIFRVDKLPSSSSTLTSQEVPKKSSTSTKVRKTTSSSSNKPNSIPTPPPSPGTEDGSISEGESRTRSRSVQGLKSDQVLQKATMNGDRKDEKVNSTDKRKGPKVAGSQLKELRESLECLKMYQSSWRGGSPLSERKKSSINVCIEGGKGSSASLLEARIRSSSGSSDPDYTRYKICGKDSIEEKEIRMKKFCKDLSTEYKKSPYSKQRRDFSEQYKLQDEIHQPRFRNTDDGRLIRNEVCARFNPADTYSRFRGSVQDTMMRRASRTHPGPPPIPIPNRRNVSLQPRLRTRREYPENSQFELSKPRFEIGGQFWSPNKKSGWVPRCPPVPTYFPISSRPVPCPHRGTDQPDRDVHSRGTTRPAALQFMRNSEPLDPRSQRCQRRYFPGLQPPRFSGC